MPESINQDHRRFLTAVTAATPSLAIPGAADPRSGQPMTPRAFAGAVIEADHPRAGGGPGTVRGSAGGRPRRERHPAGVGAPQDPIEVSAIQLIFGKRNIQGWASGIATDSEDTLRFAELTGVRPMIETYPLVRAAEAYDRMLRGKAEFRVVLTM